VLFEFLETEAKIDWKPSSFAFLNSDSFNGKMVRKYLNSFIIDENLFEINLLYITVASAACQTSVTLSQKYKI